ncbi:MAG: hypothetical protein IT316_00865 [Anaerolineales bacterium]|nr:hypothetical protein [Anaerolineales bacterium]
MKKRAFSVWNGLLLLVFLSGCAKGIGLTPSPTPAATEAPCLIGIWQIQHPETFLRASIPAGSFDPDTLKFINSIGGIAYRFDQRGVLTVEAVQFIGKFDVKIGINLEALEIKMSGFASSKYEIDGGQVKTVELLSSDMDFSALYGQDEMMADMKARDFLPLFVVPYNLANYTCSEQSLSLEFINFPNIDKPLEFKRLR